MAIKRKTRRGGLTPPPWRATPDGGAATRHGDGLSFERKTRRLAARRIQGRSSRTRWSGGGSGQRVWQGDTKARKGEACPAGRPGWALHPKHRTPGVAEAAEALFGSRDKSDVRAESSLGGKRGEGRDAAKGWLRSGPGVRWSSEDIGRAEILGKGRPGLVRLALPCSCCSLAGRRPPWRPP